VKIVQKKEEAIAKVEEQQKLNGVAKPINIAAYF